MLPPEANLKRNIRISRKTYTINQGDFDDDLAWSKKYLEGILIEHAFHQNKAFLDDMGRIIQQILKSTSTSTIINTI
jgi:hypothetical protein